MATLDLSITITPDAKAAVVLNVISTELGWTPEDGRTRARFVKDYIIEMLQGTYARAKTKEVDAVLRVAVRDDAASFTLG